MEDGFEEAAALGLGGGELRFQAVAEGHQLVDFGDDAVLFGQRRKGDKNLSCFLNTKYGVGAVSLVFSQCLFRDRTLQKKY